MKDDNASGAVGAGASVSVDSDQLDRQASQVSTLGDTLGQQANANPVHPLRLGTAPPAVKFAQQLAQLCGDTGAAGMLRTWADGLSTLAGNQQAAAATYRNTDTTNAASYQGIHPDT